MGGYIGVYVLRDTIDTDGLKHPRKVYDLSAVLLRRGRGAGNIRRLPGGTWARTADKTGDKS